MRHVEGPKKKSDHSSFLSLAGLIAGVMFVIAMIDVQDRANKGMQTDFTLAIISGAVALACLLGTIAMRSQGSRTLDNMPPPMPPGTNPARWMPDPSGEYRLRWWDGQRWTDHTHD